jgi:hypothetical protein
MQHAPSPDPQAYVLHVVPALAEEPPNIAQSDGVTSAQESSEKQHAAGSSLQVIGV